MSILRVMLIAIPACLLATTAVAANQPHATPMKQYGKAIVKQWIETPLILNAVRARNAQRTEMAPATADPSVAKLHRTRASSNGNAGAMHHSWLPIHSSWHLTKLQAASKGLITDIAVIDLNGNSVGKGALDTASLQEEFIARPTTVNVSQIQYDQTTRTWKSWLSMPITDSRDGQVVGAVIIGFDLHVMEQQFGCKLALGDCRYN